MCGDRGWCAIPFLIYAFYPTSSSLFIVPPFLRLSILSLRLLSLQAFKQTEEYESLQQKLILLEAAAHTTRTVADNDFVSGGAKSARFSTKNKMKKAVKKVKVLNALKEGGTGKEGKVHDASAGRVIGDTQPAARSGKMSL